MPRSVAGNSDLNVPSNYLHEFWFHHTVHPSATAQIIESQILVKILSVTVMHTERLLISTNTQHNNNPLGIHFMVSQFLGLLHVIKIYEGVALGFSTWQQPPSFLRHESHYMTCHP